MRLFFTGFESGDTTGSNDGYAEGFTGGSGTSSGIIQQTGARIGGWCWALTTSANGQADFVFTNPWTGALNRNYYVRAYIKKTGNPSIALNHIIRLTTGSTTRIIGVNLNTAGKLDVVDSTGAVLTAGTTVLNDNQWYRVELRCLVNTTTTGEYELRIDGNTEIAAVTNANLGTTAPGGISFGISSAGGNLNGNTLFFDDCAVNDDRTTLGSTQASWCGDGHIIRMYPNADGSVGTGWTRDNASATGLFNPVSNIPPAGIADTTASTGLHQIRNAANASNSTYTANLPTYTAAGLVSTDTIMCAQFGCITGAPSATQQKVGAINGAYGNGNNQSQVTFNFYHGTVIAGTYPNGWAVRLGGIGEADTANGGNLPIPSAFGNTPTVNVQQQTASTRIAMVCSMWMQLEYQPLQSGPANITGSAAGTGATSGALTATSLLSGSATGTSTATGQPATPSRLTGSSAGVGAATGSVTIPAQLSGSSAGAGTTTGALTAIPQLSGAAAGTGATTGAVGGQPKISGTAAGTGATTGVVGGQPQVSGTAAGTGAATGQPTASPKLSGTAAGTSTTTGALTATPVLSGTAAGSGTSSGTISFPSSSANITGSADGVGATTGTLSTTPQFSGSSAGTGTATGQPTASPKISGTAAGTGAATGQPTAASQLSGTAAGTGTVSGALTASPKLSGTSAGTSTATGALSASSQLSGTAAGVGGITGQPTVPGAANFTGTAAGTGATTGALSVTTRLSGSSAGVGATSGALTATPKISGSSAGVGNTTGSLKTTPQIIGGSNATGAAAGTLGTTPKISGLSGGVGGASGVFSFPILITGLAAGFGNVTGNLVALPTARPVLPLNTTGYIETPRAGAAGVFGTGIIKEPTTGTVS